MHNQIVESVKKLIEAKIQVAGSKSEKEKTYYENKCGALDHSIDNLVFQLYGLDQKEIQLVEQDGSSKTNLDAKAK